MMKAIILLLASAASARADCDACVNGWCHSRKTLLDGFLVSDQMAIDQTNDILYLQLNNNFNTAYYLKEQRVRLVQELRTTGMTVDRKTQSLYTAQGNNVYKFAAGSKKPEMFSPEDYSDAKFLVFGDILYFTYKHISGLNYVSDDECYFYNILNNFNITDFISVNEHKIYFVADGLVYLYSKVGNTLNNLSTLKNVRKLSTDKFGDVYFASSSVNAIYKLNKTNELEEFAAYETGTVDQFVFDSNNNVVFYDNTEGSVNLWQRGDSQCQIEMYSRYIIKKLNLPDYLTQPGKKNLEPLMTNEFLDEDDY